MHIDYVIYATNRGHLTNAFSEVLFCKAYTYYLSVKITNGTPKDKFQLKIFDKNYLIISQEHQSILMINDNTFILNFAFSFESLINEKTDANNDCLMIYYNDKCIIKCINIKIYGRKPKIQQKKFKIKNYLQKEILDKFKSSVIQSVTKNNPLVECNTINEHDIKMIDYFYDLVEKMENLDCDQYSLKRKIFANLTINKQKKTENLKIDKQKTAENLIIVKNKIMIKKAIPPRRFQPVVPVKIIKRKTITKPTSKLFVVNNSQESLFDDDINFDIPDDIFSFNNEKQLLKIDNQTFDENFNMNENINDNIFSLNNIPYNAKQDNQTENSNNFDNFDLFI